MTVDSVSTKGLVPNQGKKMIYLEIVADSADTVDITDSDITGGETLASVDFIIAWDQTTGDIVTVTDSSGTITLDAAGGTTDHTYGVIAVGDA